MSRFFASINDSESESSEEEVIEEPTRRRIVSLSSDDEPEVRIVKSVKNKIIDETNACALSIGNFKKINDYAGLLTRFEELVKIYSKYQREFTDGSGPGIFISCLAELLTYVTAAWEDVEGRKSLTKIGFKSLTSLRQKIRKFAKTFEVALKEYAVNPSKFHEEDHPEEIKQPKVEIERERSPSPDWSDSSVSSSEDDTPYSSLREKFLKKTDQKDSGKLDKKEKKKKEARKEDTNEGEWETVRGGSTDFLKPPQLFSADSDVTPKSIIDKLNEVAGKRGMKRSDRVKQLEEIYEVAVEKQCGPGVLVKAKICQVTTLFDYSMAKQDCLKAENWAAALKRVEKVSDIISGGDFILLGDSFDEEQLEVAPYKVRLNLAALVERLCEEHKRILKATDWYTVDYWNRLKDDEKIITVIDRFIAFLEEKNQTDDLCRLKTSEVELMYYKLHKDPKEEKQALERLESLCKYVYVQDETQRLRTRAILAHIYYHAIHDRWHPAKNLMLMSHLQSSIEFADVDTQILFNRAIAQLGLCAFRQGHVYDAHTCLMHLIRGGSKTRQLLGQGVFFRRDGSNREQEAKERQLQLPPHMHILLEHIEASFMVSAMLVEVPHLMQAEGEARSRIISRSFKHLLRNSDRGQQVPPETVHQYIADACRALTSFNWRLCRDLIFNPTMDIKVWNRIEQPTHVKDNIVRLIQKQTLKLFLKDLATQVYDSVSIADLTEQFGLESEAETQSFLAGLINNGHLNASISISQEILIFHPGSRLSDLHKRAHWMTDVCQQLLEQSERIFGVNDRFYRKTSNRHGF